MNTGSRFAKKIFEYLSGKGGNELVSFEQYGPEGAWLVVEAHVAIFLHGKFEIGPYADRCHRLGFGHIEKQSILDLSVNDII